MANGVISRIKRNHGLEHATIHVLAERNKRFSAQGNSDHRGFHLNIFGDIPESEVESAVSEAHRRLNAGEHHLAVHPNCGTVLVTTATLATLAAQLVLALDQRGKENGRLSPASLLNSMPGATIAVVVALIVGRPLGVQIQERYTVDGKLGDLQVSSVRRVPPSLFTRLFQLLLTGGSRQFPSTSYFVRTTGGDS